MAHENRCPQSRAFARAFADFCMSAFTEGAVASPRARVRTVSRTGASSGRVPTFTGTSETSGQPDNATPAIMKAQAVAARTRCRQTFDTDVEASRRKDDWGAPNSYPRRGDHSSPPTRRHPVYDPRRRISKAAATRLGDARGTTHDITGLKARTFTSLQKKDLRLARSDRAHSRRGRALNSAGVPPAALGVPTTVSPSPSTSSLSPTPGWEVASFVPDRIEIPDVPGDYIMVLGKIPVPQNLLVDFLTKSHHPLAYSCRDRVVSTPVGAPRDDRPSVPMEANASTTSSVDAKSSPMAQPITTAGPAMPSSIAEHTPAAGPTVPSPTVDTTPESGPAVPSSIAEPTPVAESAVEAPSSLAEPTPPPTEPVVGPVHAPGDGNNWPTPAEASLGSFVRDDAATVPMPDEAARPSAMPSRPGVKRSPGDLAGPAGTEEVADVLPLIGEDGPFSSWDSEGLVHSVRSYDTEEDGWYSPRVRHRTPMKRYNSTLARGRRRLYSLRHHRADSGNTARRESRYEADAALPSAMERLHLYSLRRRPVVRSTGDPAGLASTADPASDATPVAPSSLAEPTPSSTELVVRPDDAALSARPAIPSEIITNVVVQHRGGGARSANSGIASRPSSSRSFFSDNDRQLLVRLTRHLTGLAEETIEEARTAQPSLTTTTEGAVNVNEALAATLAEARTSLQNNLEALDESTARLKDAMVLRDTAERATGTLEP